MPFNELAGDLHLTLNGGAPSLVVPKYVATTGNDTTGDGGPSSPWRTIGFAVRQLRDGDLLYVRGGTYTENVIVGAAALPSGSGLLGITVENYPDERPLIAGVVLLENADYWTISGLDVDALAYDGTGGKHSAVRMSGGSHWTWRKSHIRGGNSLLSQVFYVSDGAANWTIEQCEIHDGVDADLIRVYTSTIGLIQHTLLHDAPNGHGVKLGTNDINNPTPNGITVRYTTIVDTLKHIMLISGTRNTEVYGNIFYRTLAGLGAYAVDVWGLSGGNNSVTDNYGYLIGAVAHPDLASSANVLADPLLDGNDVPSLAALLTGGIYQYGHLQGLSQPFDWATTDGSYAHIGGTLTLALGGSGTLTVEFVELAGVTDLTITPSSPGYDPATGEGTPGSGLVTLVHIHHWRGLREGDYALMHLPYAGVGGSSPLVRVLKRSYKTGDTVEDLDLQYISMQVEPRKSAALGTANPRVRRDNLPGIIAKLAKGTSATGGVISTPLSTNPH